mmetsp:Transcript_108218/g.186862  ORF Transcript_108218/g.186862 Transcript_108218/m.186862 type:complete len:393 (-) Transcript_108218:310-1488(-)
MADNNASKKPADTPFKQQRLPAWQPILSPPWVICCFFVVAVVFIPIGALVIVASGKVVEYEIEYAAEASRTCRTMIPGQKCEEWISIDIDKDMEPPVYMYYKLENFYQNHRRYAKSRSDTQLAGSSVSYNSISDCKPVRYKGELMDQTQFEPNSDTGIRNIYAPCGLIGWSMFNDSFSVYMPPSKSTNCGQEPSPCVQQDIICVGYLKPLGPPASVPVDQQCTDNGIAWESDVDSKFQAPYRGEGTDQFIQSYNGQPAFYYNETPSTTNLAIEGHVVPIQTDPDFMVWMRIASLPTFRKLYRIFPTYTGFKAGTKVWIKVDNRFRVSDFGGRKFVILSTTSWIGGKNYFLGIAYVVVGCLCFLLGVIFAVKHVLFGRSNAGNDNYVGSHKPN